MIRKFGVVCLLGVLTHISSPVFADWSPEDIEDADVTKVQDTKYQSLKASILYGLKGSWCSEEKTHLLMDLVVLTKPKICVEIGACTGSSVLPVAAALKFLGSGKVYAIDAWSNQIATRYWDDQDPNKPWWSTVDMKAVQQSYKNLLKAWKVEEVCTTLAAPSENAVKKFNHNIDFLHLDGDYSEKGSMADLENYLPHVKEGGYILLSNFFVMVNGKQPKVKCFKKLVSECEIVAEIERDNAILFRKF